MSDSDQQRSGGVSYLIVDEDASGQRLDNYLAKQLKGVPRTRLYRALRKGEIRVNKGRVRADYRLVSGDRIRIPPLRQPPPAERPSIPRYWMQQLEQRVVYEDGDLLVINKPSGLAVHGGSGLKYGLIECLRQMYPERRYLELVHRLDRDTSGLIMIANRPAALRELHRQLRENVVDKHYLALVGGSWPRSLRRVEAPLEKNILRSGERMVKVSREGKPAVTEFQVLERLADATLIEAKPVTGKNPPDQGPRATCRFSTAGRREVRQRNLHGAGPAAGTQTAVPARLATPPVFARHRQAGTGSRPGSRSRGFVR